MGREKVDQEEFEVPAQSAGNYTIWQVFKIWSGVAM